MADLSLFDPNFNANEVEPLGDFSPIPAGEYQCIIVKSEKKTTAKGDGEYVSFTFQVINGEFQNRQLFTNLNLRNKNPKAVQIARAELSSICRAVGVPSPKMTEELHNKPLIVKCKIVKRQDTGDMNNETSGYKPVNPDPADKTKAASMSAATPAQQAPPAAAQYQPQAPQAPQGVQPANPFA